MPALFAALFVLLFIVQPARVDGTSMEPSFQNGERVLMEKLSYRFHAPARGDVVLMRLPGQSQPIVKRVIAVGGDQVAVRNGQVYLNGAPLEEPYLDGLTPGEAPSMQVPMGYLFILGDNRSHSQDSRLFGMVDSGDVVGRAAFTYWPLSRLGTVR